MVQRYGALLSVQVEVRKKVLQQPKCVVLEAGETRPARRVMLISALDELLAGQS